MLAVRIVLYLIAGYAALVAALWYFQTGMLFPAEVAEAQAPPLPPEARSLEAVAVSGDRLVGVHLPPAGENGERLLILGFGGNGWNAGGVALHLHGLFPEAHVAAFHYRGYSPSSGAPSAAALLEDALIVHDSAVAEVEPDRVVAVGFSLGTGVAAYLSRHRALSGLILTTPFDRLTAVAEEHYPWAPVGLLFRHPMPAVEFVAGRPTPTALIVAEEDRVIPPARAEALAPAIERLVMNRRIAGAGHNDLTRTPQYRAAMTEALGRVLASAPASP